MDLNSSFASLCRRLICKCLLRKSLYRRVQCNEGFWINVLMPVFVGLLVVNGSITATAQVVIGGIAPDSSAMLDIQSKGRGFLLPRVSKAQRDSIPAPAEGLQVYNLTSRCLEANMGSRSNPVWIPIDYLGIIQELKCGDAAIDRPIVVQTSVYSSILSVPYSEGNGGAYPELLIQSTGVEGLIAKLNHGHFEYGEGVLALELSGMTQDTGIANFNLAIGGEHCSIGLNVEIGLIENLKCEEVIVSDVLVQGTISDSAKVIVAYSGGNGGPYPADTFISSGVTGVTATIPSSYFTLGDSILTMELSGIPDSSGLCSFNLTNRWAGMQFSNSSSGYWRALLPCRLPSLQP